MKALKQAQALLAEGKGNMLVHFINDDECRGISRPVSVDEYRDSGYISTYYWVSEVADPKNWFDVLAVIGNESETMHVEPIGTVANGTRTLDGQEVYVMGEIFRIGGTEMLRHDQALRKYINE